MLVGNRKVRVFVSTSMPCCQWRGCCKVAVAGFYAVFFMVILPVLIYKITTQDSRGKSVAWFVAGLFVLLTLPVFLVGLVQHFLNYTQPHLQKHIIRILWIVPIYSLNSFLALTFPKSAIYLDTLRECYEAYVLYNFLCYLCNFLTSEYDLVAELEARPTVTHFIPCCCLPPWPKGAIFVRRCRIGVLQYVMVRVAVTIVALITQLCHVYTRGELKANNAWVYLSIINGISQGGALHSLVYFYRGTRELLQPLHPIGKFMSIKAIIFAMFWQTMLISVFVKTGVVPASWHEYELQEGLQNYLVVLEMLLFAIAHFFVFSHKPYIDPAAAEVPCIATCLRMLDVRDIAGDVKEHFVDPIPRPKFRTGGANHGTNLGREGQGENGGKKETSPLLKNHMPNGAACAPKTASGLDAPPQDSGGLSDLSYDVVTYKELQGRTAYGLRARMIANAACKEMEEVVDAEGDTSSEVTTSGDSTPTQELQSPAKKTETVIKF